MRVKYIGFESSGYYGTQSERILNYCRLIRDYERSHFKFETWAIVNKG